MYEIDSDNIPFTYYLILKSKLTIIKLKEVLLSENYKHNIFIN